MQKDHFKNIGLQQKGSQLSQAQMFIMERLEEVPLLEPYFVEVCHEELDISWGRFQHKPFYDSVLLSGLIVTEMRINQRDMGYSGKVQLAQKL